MVALSPTPTRPRRRQPRQQSTIPLPTPFSMTLPIIFLALYPSTGFAAPARQPLDRRAIQPIYDGAQVSGKTYDYVIAGGGLTGSVLASRLSEDGGKTVLVVEAGYDEEGNTGVTDASKYQSTFNTFLDWAYQTVPQTSANGATQTMRSGRGLGGSTIINGMAWSKPHDFQLDALEEVGNEGVNWESLQKYMLRAETFTPPTSTQLSAGLTYNPSCHPTSSSGPLGIQYDPNASPNQVERAFNQTVQGQGLPYVTDLTCGDPAGAAPIANTRTGGTRNDAYRAYLYTKTRPNLTILSGANVGRITFSSDSTPRATGLEFKDEKGKTYSVKANLEVILALGSIKTPIILQQSGVGPADVLSAAGVTQKVDLPVGLNLIDQTTVTTDWSFSGNRGGGQPITFPRFQDLFSGDDANNLRSMLQNDLGSYVQDAINSGSASSASSAGLQKVLEIQRDWILNQNVAFSENFDYTYDSTLGYDSWFLLPFGRGSIKINSNDPYSTSSYSINPRYFANPFDRLAQGGTVRYTRKVSEGSPLNQYANNESVPGKGAVPDGGSLEDWASWSEDHYRSNWHPIGTAPMMSKQLGGCVDANNKLYGVNNLRVVDASLLPFQVSSHLMSVMYGLAERASDIIKSAHPSGPTSSSSSSSTTATSTSSSSSSSTAPPTRTAVPVHPSLFPSKCLDVVDGNLSNGALVQVWDCNNKAQQQWTLTPGSTTVRVAGTNFCLDAGSGSPASGTRMKIWTCIDRIAAQQWQVNGDGTIALTSASQCLDLTDGSGANGNGVQVWSCGGNNPNHKWTRG